jgi:hypothetical protein
MDTLRTGLHPSKSLPGELDADLTAETQAKSGEVFQFTNVSYLLWKDIEAARPRLTRNWVRIPLPNAILTGLEGPRSDRTTWSGP